jgi:hypothetical protein
MTGDAKTRDWVEIVATFLLSVAAIATAWSSYQATRWNGEQAKASGSEERDQDRGGPRSGPGRGGHRGRCCDLHPVGQRARPRAARAGGLLPQAVSGRVRARIRRLARNQAIRESRRARDSLQDAGVPARRGRRGQTARCSCGALLGEGPSQHPARLGLRSLRRPFRGFAVLRRNQHEDRGAGLAEGAARCRQPSVCRYGRLARNVPSQFRHLGEEGG